MKHRLGLFVAIFVILGIGGYAVRGNLRDVYFQWTAPKLPTAAKYQSAGGQIALSGEQGALVEGGVATSEHYTLVSSPPAAPKIADPFDSTKTLPSEANLDVPFTSQAPYGDWSLPYEETCEEASSIMVDSFYHEKTGVIPKEDAKQEIDSIVAYEMKIFGDYKSTSAEDTAKMIKGYFGYRDVRVLPLQDVEQIKRAVANGYPVMIPASGKELPNPNFRNGGPIYHMLVVKGYTSSRFITNDPGTRNGADYTYTYDALMSAAHDWNGGDVVHGTPMMIVVVPNP